MKKLLFFFSLMFAICANAQIDTLNYALGYHIGRDVRIELLPFIHSEDDIKELYLGIEENTPTPEIANDSTYIVNYAMGVMQATFFSDGLEHRSKDDLPPLDCIIAGLQKVANNQVNLPQDTIEAKRIIASRPDSIKAVQLPEEERCAYFTAFGVLKSFPDGLDQLIAEYGVENVEPNYQYYAQGFSDVLVCLDLPNSLYNYGKIIAFSLHSATTDDMPEDIVIDFTSPDFLAGIRAALGLEEPKLSGDEINNFINSISE